MSADITFDGMSKLLRADNNNYQFTMDARCRHGVHKVTITESRCNKKFRGEDEDFMKAMWKAVELASEWRADCDGEAVA